MRYEDRLALELWREHIESTTDASVGSIVYLFVYEFENEIPSPEVIEEYASFLYGFEDGSENFSTEGKWRLSTKEGREDFWAWLDDWALEWIESAGAYEGEEGTEGFDEDGYINSCDTWLSTLMVSYSSDMWDYVEALRK